MAILAAISTHLQWSLQTFNLVQSPGASFVSSWDITAVAHGMPWSPSQCSMVVEPLPMLIQHRSLCMCRSGWHFEYCWAVLVLNQESGSAGLRYVWSRIFWVLDLLPPLKWPLKLDFLVRNWNFNCSWSWISCDTFGYQQLVKICLTLGLIVCLCFHKDTLSSMDLYAGTS